MKSSMRPWGVSEFVGSIVKKQLSLMRSVKDNKLTLEEARKKMDVFIKSAFERASASDATKITKALEFIRKNRDTERGQKRIMRFTYAQRSSARKPLPQVKPLRKRL